MSLDDKVLLEITAIVNEPGLTWKVRRALLRHKYRLSEEQIQALVPERDPRDY